MGAISTIAQRNPGEIIVKERSIPELRAQAVRATLLALAVAAQRHDHVAAANLGTALRTLEGNP